MVDEQDEFNLDQLSAWGDDDTERYTELAVATPLPQIQQTTKRPKHLRSSKAHSNRTTKHSHTTREHPREDASLTQSKSTGSLLSTTSIPLHFSMFRLADGVQPGLTRLAPCTSSSTVLEPVIHSQSKHSSAVVYQAPTVFRHKSLTKYPKRSFGTNSGRSSVVCHVITSASPLPSDHLPQLALPDSRSEHTEPIVKPKVTLPSAEKTCHLPMLGYSDESDSNIEQTSAPMCKSRSLDAFASMLSRQLCKSDRTTIDVYRQNNQSALLEWGIARRRHTLGEINDSTSRTNGEDTAEVLVRTLTQFTKKESTKVSRAADIPPTRSTGYVPATSAWKT